MRKNVKGIAVAIAAFLCGLSPAKATETILLRYQSFQETIEVDELKDFAKDGELPPTVDRIVRLLGPTQRELLLAILQTQLDIDANRIREFLDTDTGQQLLKEIASLAGKDNPLQLFFLRIALIRAAENADLSVIRLLEAYPEEEIELNLENALRLAQTFNAGFWQTQAFALAIAPQLAPSDLSLDIPFDPTQPGNAQFQTLDLKLTDETRSRQIPVKLYLSSAADHRKPLILFSHGLFSVNTELRYLAEHLASHGYAVAIPEHPGSNETHLRAFLGNLDGPLLDPKKLFAPSNLVRTLPQLVEGKLLAPEEQLNRPRDLSFVLDELEKLNATSSQLRGKLGTERVLVLGYSLGGSTALAVAGAEMQLDTLKQVCRNRNLLASNLGVEAQCVAKDLPENRYQLGDPRIGAAIALSPTTSLLFGETGLSQLQVPTLIAAASADKTTPALTEQLSSFLDIPQPKWLVGILGGTHLSVKDPGTTQDQAGQPDTIYSGGEIVGDRATEVRNYIKAISLAMAAQLTEGGDRYAIFLTPEYAEFASTQRIDFRLARDISPEIVAEMNRVLLTTPNVN
ncbi:MAG: alpha/beta hydrolase [Cyanobacteriota bacterium]|nr:alpha/beta hydrolase [Cyanobacteriota bacterium]